MPHPNAAEPSAPALPYEPARPTLVATLALTVWVALLSLPMLGGKFLAGPWSDQITAGLPFRGWGADWWRRLGHVPLWNPEIFGGMPYVAAIGTGDILYPTALLRLVLPTATVINLGFFVHYVLAGVCTYLLLRRLAVSWGGAVVAGLAYQLSGIVASYAQPGHDGKLVVTALLPLVLLGLVIGMRERRLWGYSLAALGVGLSILSQHVQMTYYMLIAAGLFALYLAFGSGPAPTRARLTALALALAAVGVGFAVAAIQLLPAFAHLPLSSRAAGYQGGFAGATSYAIPWVHVPEFFLKDFVGAAARYWGSNPLKLHSEYLGLPVLGLAVVGATAPRDRALRLWLAGIGLLFLLISLGAATPFYRLWWSVMPYVKQMRAPGMAFFVVAFVVASFAGLGVDRLERRTAPTTIARHITIWWITTGLVALLALAGVFGALATSFGEGRAPDRDAILFGAVTSALALALAATVAWAGLTGRLAAPRWVPVLLVVLGADLWVNARGFWTYSTAHRDLYEPDAIITRIKTTPLPYRVLELGALTGPRPVYHGAHLMALDVPQLLGEHGLEIRYFDELLGGRGQWRHVANIRLWDLFAIRWVIVPAPPPGQNGEGIDSIPGFRRVLQSVPTADGTPAHLFERTEPAPYARVVPAAAALDSAQIVPTVTDPRMAYDRVVLLDVRDSLSPPPPPLHELPPPSGSAATVRTWTPGAMTISIAPPPGAPSYLLVAENWYPGWRATVNGAPAPIVRGNWSLITVPLPAGATDVALEFTSPPFARGKIITWFAILLLLVPLAAPVVARLRRHG